MTALKALVLEIKDGKAAVLCEDGTVTTTDQPCRVGDIIELETKVVSFEEAKARRARRWTRPLVAAALALVILGGSYRATTAYATSYVSLDVEESSVELSVNMYGRVIDVDAVNEESEELAESLRSDVRNLRVDDALDRAVRVFDERGFLEGEDAALVAGVTSDSAAFGEETSAALERLGGRDEGGFRFVTVDVTRDQRQEARRSNMSGGRFCFEQRRDEFEEEGFFFPHPGDREAPPPAGRPPLGAPGG